MIRMVRDLLGHLRWVLSGRPPVHIDASLTAISMPYSNEDDRTS